MNCKIHPIICLTAFIGAALLFSSTPMAAADTISPSKVASTSTKSDQSSANKHQIANLLASDKESFEDEILILQLKLGSLLLADDFLGLNVSAGLLLPLRELSTAIGFNFSVDANTGRAGGWFIRENRLFSLNVGNREIVIDGKKGTYESGLVKIAEDDIFVDVRLLAKWFPIDIDFDIANMSVELTSREPLPHEEMLARDQRRKSIRKNRSQTLYPRHDIKYKLLSAPMVDISMDHTFSSDSDDNVTNNTRISGLATADLLGHSAQLYLSGDDSQRISQARLEMGRKDPDGKLLSLLDATEYSFGDISTSQVSLVAGSTNGRGVKISNHPVDIPDEFDRITLEGDLLTGWDVELYRNEVLVDFKSSQADGRYNFTDVPLLFGVNILKLMFYGPQGQIREEIKQLRIGPGQIKPGQTLYKAYANQQDVQVLLGDEHDLTATDQTGKTRANLNIQHGISKNLSVGANLTTVPSVNGNHQNFLGVSLHGFLDSVTGRLDVVRDLGKGWAGKVAVQTSIADISLFADHARFYDFSSEQISNQSDPLLHQSNLRLDGIARVPFVPHVPYSFKITHDYHQSAISKFTVNNRLSMAIGAAAVTNNLNWILNRTETEEDSNISGSATIGGSINDVRLRGQLIYALDPDALISSGTISGDWQMTENYRAKLAIDKNFVSDHVTKYSAGLTTQFDAMALGGAFDYSDSGDLSARISLNFSLGQDPTSHSPFIRGNHIAGKGGVASRVFLDNNSNGVFDENDVPLKNAALKFGSSESKFVTNEEGLVTATGITPFRPVNVSVDKKSLEDPFWTPASEGVSIIPRPGAFGVIDFPILTSGEIDGTVYRKKNKWASEVSDVNLQLIDSKGTVVHETSSSFDGFYLFDFVRPGSYSVRVEPEQMSRLGIPQPAPRSVEITGEGSLVSNLDFILDSDRGSENFRVLLTAFGNLNAAKNAWSILHKEMPRNFKKLRPIIEKDLSPDGKKTLYYLYTGSFGSRGAAETLCKNVRQKKGQSWCNPIRIQIETDEKPDHNQDADKSSTLSGTMLLSQKKPH